MARLKVYTTTQGFHETAVAASSQAKALEAWGTRQNLFAEGLARVTTDPAVVAAAMARPGEVVRKPASSAAEIKAVMDAPKPAAKGRRGPAGPGPADSGWTAVKAARPRPPRDRTRLDAAEAALATLEKRRAAAAREADKARRTLEERLGREAAALEREAARLKAAAEKARAAYERD